MSTYNRTEIWIVDDDPGVAKLIKRNISAINENCNIELYSKGSDVIGELESEDSKLPDLIILDTVMMGMSGIKVLQWIRRNPTTKHIKILAISGYPVSLQQMEKRGADTILEKPFSQIKLEKKVLSLLSEYDNSIPLVDMQQLQVKKA